MNIKQNKGVSSADAIIAVVILMIFTGIIATISSNIYTQTQYIKRNEQATNFCVEIFEYANGILYDDVNAEKLTTYIGGIYDKVHTIDGKYSENNVNTSGYTIFINVNDDEHPDYIKQIDITVAYKLKGKIKTVDMSTLINK